jgi:biotin synthase
MSRWKEFANRILAGEEISKEEALEIAFASDAETFAIVEQASRLREAFWQNRVRLYMLLNAKSGLCPEDCGYCSQSKVSQAAIPKYPLLSKEKILEAAGRAHELKVHTFCMVASGRGPTDHELQKVGQLVQEIKLRYPLKICTCLGLLKEGQAHFLKSCGVDTYNHNLNTSRNFYSEVCKTHTFEDRIQTVKQVKEAGIGTCSGGIVGMGESPKDWVDLAFELKALGVDSIPVNFLYPIDGTPMQNRWNLTPLKALRYLAVFRFVHPKADLRMAGGRELHLRSLQPLGLRVANSFFIGDYLTTKGQSPQADYQMIEDLGYVFDEPAFEKA